MKEVYFDTNVYDLLDELIQTKVFAPVDKLRKAIRSDQLRVYTNIIPIEETLGALKKKPAEGRRRLRLIRTLAKRKRMIRWHKEIIVNDIRSYALNEPFQSHFTFPDPELKPVFQVRDLPGLIEVAEENRNHNRGFRDDMRGRFVEFIAPLAEPVIENREVPTFEEYFEANTEAYSKSWRRRQDILTAVKNEALKDC